jgi:hypothetical protein
MAAARLLPGLQQPAGKRGTDQQQQQQQQLQQSAQQHQQKAAIWHRSASAASCMWIKDQRLKGA